MNIINVGTKHINGETRRTITLFNKIKLITFAVPTQTVPRGVSGQDISRGVLNTDFNPNLQHPEGASTFDRMRKSDTQVRKQLRGMIYPILAAEWSITVPAGKEDDTRVGEARDFLEGAILGKGPSEAHYPSFTFRQHMREALTMLPFGFSTFELVWKGIEGKMIIDRLQLRAATSLQRVEIGPNGEILGLWQARVYSADDDKKAEGNSSQKKKGFRGTDIYLPMDTLLHYTFEQEGINIWGESILRSMYKPWKFKELLERYDMIDSQRRAAGMPVGKLGELDGDDERSELIKIVRDMDGSNPESRWAVLTAGQELGFVNNDAKAKPIAESITRFDRAIADGASGRFMDGGEQAGGTKAVNNKLSDQFFVTLNAIAEELTETINRQWVDRLLEINFPGLDGKPRLTFSRLALDEGLALVDALGVAKQAGLIERWGLEDENNMRDHLRLRRMTEEEAEELEAKAEEKLKTEQDNAMAIAGAKGDGQSMPAKPGGGKAKTSKDPRAAERGRQGRADKGRKAAGLSVDPLTCLTVHGIVNRESMTDDSFFDEILLMPQKRVKLKEFELEYAGAITLVTKDIRSDFIKRVRRGEISIGNVSRVKAKHAGLLQQALTGIADRVSAFGVEMVATELTNMREAQVFGTTIPDRRPDRFFAIAQEAALAGVGIDVGKILREEENILMALVEQAAATGADPEALADAIAAQYGIRVDTYIDQLGRRGTARSYNAGRDTAVRTTQVAENAVRNEEMDRSTCENCADIHGLVVKVGSADYYDFMPPNYCQGYDQCRGEYTYFPAA